MSSCFCKTYDAKSPILYTFCLLYVGVSVIRDGHLSYFRRLSQNQSNSSLITDYYSFDLSLISSQCLIFSDLQDYYFEHLLVKCSSCFLIYGLKFQF
jgi:hypothetical protein